MAIFDKNDKKEILKVRRAVLRKFPALATTMSTLKFKATRKVETAATDGEKVYYNPDFMGRLKFDEKVFVMAHETMHVSHNHLVRAGKKKDLGSWNTATDAVINQTLVDEGLPIPQVEGMNFVDIPDAKDKSAEQMYKKLRTQKRRDQQQQAQQQGGQSKQGNQSGSPQQSQPEQSQPQQSGQGQSSQSSGQQPQNSGSSGGQPQQSTGAGTQSQPSGQSQTRHGGGQTEDRTQEGGSSGGDGETQDKTSQGQGGSGQKQQKQPEQTQSEGSGETKPKKDYEQKGHSDHDMWKKAIEKAKKQQEKDKKDKSSLKPDEKKKEEPKEDKKDEGDKKPQDKKPDEKKTDDKKPQEKPQTDKPKGQPQEQPKADKPQKPKQSEESGGEESEGEKVTEDDYSAEEDSFKESHREKVKKDTDTEGEEKEEDEEGSEDDLREKEFRELNKKLRKELVEKMKQAIERKADGAKDRTFGRGAGQEKGKFGQVGDAKAVVSWRTILRREFDKDQPEWSYRRSSEENYYMARIENRIMFEQPMTEVMLDTSGSIDDVLLRGFLRQLKPLLKSSKMKVACFDDDVYGFVEIKTNEDIDSFTFYGRGGTNLDAPVRAFSKDRKVNKIIFTDGCGYMPREDLKDVNVIWLIFDNDDFHPCCGKVIYVNKAEVIKEEDDYENESDI